MKTYFITRFSIFDPKAGSWVLSRQFENEPEKLKKLLFNEKRLNEKFWCFENITYESILKQKNKNYKWLIYMSDQLQQKYKDRIKLGQRIIIIDPQPDWNE